MARPFGSKKLTPQQVIKGWNNYINYCKEYTSPVVSAGRALLVSKPRIPTVGGFCLFIGISVDALEDYRKDNAYKDYHEIVKYIDSCILSGKLDALINGEGNTTGLIFELKVSHGMNEKNIVENSGTSKIIVEYGKNSESSTE